MNTPASTASAITDESTAVELWAEIWRLREAVKGPDGFATWQDAATDERIRRVRAERALNSKPTTQPTTQAGHVGGETLQPRVLPWLLACFGEEIAGDRQERNHRFLEESLELVQSCGCSASEAHQLVDYVFGRPVGEPDQEVGGVMITLAALCLANKLDMHEAGERELARIWTMVEKIRAKQAAKPKHSPLPIAIERAPCRAEPARSGRGN